MSNIVKIILLVVGVGIVGIIIFFIITALGGKPAEEAKKPGGILGENRADVYNDYSINEWNSFRFKYKDDWIVEKSYGDRGLDKVLIKQGEELITIGGKKDCSDMADERCVMAGYGIIIEPIYTASKDQAVLAVFDNIVNSIIGFQGNYSFDSKQVKDLIASFFEARLSGNIEAMKDYITVSFYNDNTFSYLLSGDIRWARYELSGGMQYLSNEQYQFKVIVYEYQYDKSKETGKREVVIKILNDDGRYLIDGIKLGKLESL
ncbi:MAG: hypothetical protein BWY21_01304 [Parcubacteria group bacterium ADurb.Bin216]|nr:MAG: hypothetical protein BWY21_01304 [Parcubacteria group bacterium ADurb.Bin216]